MPSVWLKGVTNRTIKSLLIALFWAIQNGVAHLNDIIPIFAHIAHYKGDEYFNLCILWTHEIRCVWNSFRLSSSSPFDFISFLAHFACVALFCIEGCRNKCLQGNAAKWNRWKSIHQWCMYTWTKSGKNTPYILQSKCDILHVLINWI